MLGQQKSETNYGSQNLYSFPLCKGIKRFKSRGTVTGIMCTYCCRQQYKLGVPQLKLNKRGWYQRQSSCSCLVLNKRLIYFAMESYTFSYFVLHKISQGNSPY